MCDNFGDDWSQKWHDIPLSCIECPIHYVRTNCERKSMLDEWKWYGHLPVGDAARKTIFGRRKNTGILDELCKMSTCSPEGLKRILLSPEFNCHIPSKHPHERTSRVNIPVYDEHRNNNIAAQDQYGNKENDRFIKFVSNILKRDARRSHSRMHSRLLQDYFKELSRLYWSTAGPPGEEAPSLSALPSELDDLNLLDSSSLTNLTSTTSSISGRLHRRSSRITRRSRGSRLSLRKSRLSIPIKITEEDNDSESLKSAKKYVPVLFHMPFSKEKPASWTKGRQMEDQALPSREHLHALPEDDASFRRPTQSFMSVTQAASAYFGENYRRRSTTFFRHHEEAE